MYMELQWRGWKNAEMYRHFLGPQRNFLELRYRIPFVKRWKTCAMQQINDIKQITPSARTS